jgi:poly-gamma-glutamate synthesis protein (capsule biosynthesis protein)
MTKNICLQLLGIIFSYVFVFSACTTSSSPTIQSNPVLLADTPRPLQTDTLSPKPSTAIPDIPTPKSATPVPALWAPEYIPEEIITVVSKSYQFDVTSNQQLAKHILDLNGENLDAHWIYVLAAPFPTTYDGVTQADLFDAWSGDLETGPFMGIPLRVDSETHTLFSTIWGKPSPESVQVIPQNELLNSAWENMPSWAIIPFEQLDPRWKVLQIDGISPIQKGFDPESYPLTVGFSLSGNDSQRDTISNYDSNKLSDVMLTGVTAMVRGTALTMERKGITYPGEDIAPITTQVDFMHVNNEIPFTPDCPYPDLYPQYLVFCSDVRYLELLKYIGTDIIELSGDHFGDHGSAGTLFTLNLYDEAGLPYYGGGRDLEDGRKPYLIEHHGNKIAILGCNAKGNDYYAPADENTPGAVTCDFEWMETEIDRLKNEGYQVIVTFQHVEYYSFEAQPDLVRDFGRVAAAGAVIVSGSQSHQAHGMAFVDGAFLHYGLGNLFFDQYLYCEDAVCDYGFMDRHIFYDGRYISTELIPIRFIDMARPRPMTAEEKAWFLDLIFQASGWKLAN